MEFTLGRRILAALLALGLIAALIVWLIADGDGDGGSQRATGPDYTPMTAGQRADMKRVAMDDAGVLALTHRHRTSVAAIEPWINGAGNLLVGSVVRIAIRPPVRLEKHGLPVYITPGPYAPPGTPSLEKVLRTSATRVSELRAYVLLGPERVVEIEPAGAHAAVTEQHLLGPPLGRSYQRPTGE